MNKINEYEILKLAKIANKSIGQEKRVRKNFTKIKKGRALLVLSAFTAFVTLSGWVINIGYDKMTNEIKIYQETRFAYEEDFNKNSHRLLNGNQFYNNDKNAEAILKRLNAMEIYEEEDIMLELYKMYSLMSSSANRNELTNMNEVMYMLKFMTSHDEKFQNLPENFTDLVKAQGFVNEDGTLQMNEYEKTMKAVMLEKIQEKEALDKEKRR